jgi:hypothetical protein
VELAGAIADLAESDIIGAPHLAQARRPRVDVG